MQQLLPPKLVLILLITMALLHATVPIATLLGYPWRLFGLAPLVAGLGLTGHGGRLFGRIGTNIKTFNDPDTLVDDGVFAHTRNPMYLGFTVFLIGAAGLLGTASVWVGPITFFAAANAWYIPFEERRMVATFGETYGSYQARVPRWIGVGQ